MVHADAAACARRQETGENLNFPSGDDGFKVMV